MRDLSGKKVIKWVCIILIGFIFAFQLYQSFYSPVTTGAVIHYDTYNGINIEATAVRDESVLTTTKSGVISYNVEDGGKIQNGGSVADIYATEEDANTESRIEQLQSTVDNLEEVNGYENSEAVDIDMLDSKIHNSLIQFINEANSGKISSGTEYSSELLKLLNRRQIVTGISDGYSDLLYNYKSRLENLKANKNGAVAKVKSKASGYFVSGIDGYETVLNSKKIKKLTPAEFESIKPKNQDYEGTVVGKIVSDYEWYLAAEISLDDSLKLTEGKEMVLLTNFESVPKLPVTVKHINKGNTGNHAVVVFSCTYMNSELATMRTHNMTVILENYSGLQVNSKAVRFENGKKGVYVLSGSVISFVPINVLYSTDSYCICEAKTTGVRLKLYDEVIIKGKNLYDGKVID